MDLNPRGKHIEIKFLCVYKMKVYKWKFAFYFALEVIAAYLELRTAEFSTIKPGVLTKNHTDLIYGGKSFWKSFRKWKLTITPRKSTDLFFRSLL